MSSTSTTAGPSRRRTLLVVVWTGLLVALWTVLLPPPPAQAHARLVGTVPAEAGIVAVGTADIRLIFNEPVAPASAGFVVYDRAGNARPTGAASVDADVRVALPADLPRGSYLLSWRVISGDGHVIASTLTFGYGEAYRPVTAPDGLRPMDPTALAAVGGLQVLAYLGLLVMSGLTWFSAAVLRGMGDEDSIGRPRRIVLWASGIVGVMASLLLAPLLRTVDAGDPLSAVLTPAAWVSAFTSSAGLPAALALAGTVGALAACGGRSAGAARRWSAVAAATLALLSLTLIGHTRTEEPVWLATTADLVHVSAAAGWLGGIVGLALVLRRGTGAVPGAARAAVLVSRFSLFAAILVASLGASGVALAVLILPTPAAVVTTDYGRTLLVKLALVAVVAVLALWNRARLVPSVVAAPTGADGWRRLRSAVRDELVMLVAIVCATGVLVTLSPDTGSARPTATLGTFGGPLGGGAEVAGSLTPARIGDNVVELTVRGADGQLLTPVELPDVTATLAEPAIGPIEASVTELTPGRYRASLRLDAPGRWAVDIAIRTTDQQRATVRTVIAVAQ